MKSLRLALFFLLLGGAAFGQVLPPKVGNFDQFVAQPGGDQILDSITLDEANQDFRLFRFSAGNYRMDDGASGAVNLRVVGAIESSSSLGFRSVSGANLSNFLRPSNGPAMGINSGGQIYWYDAVNITGASADVGIERSASGIIEVSDASTGQGSLFLDELHAGAGSATDPSVTFNDDLDTGLGATAGDSDEVHLIAGGVTAVTYTESTGVLAANQTTASITASTTQTQGNGALTSSFNEVSTVAFANDTVTLPVAVTGQHCVVINNGANTLQVFPASGDNLGAGVDTATTQTTGTNVHYFAYDATNWESI